MIACSKVKIVLLDDDTSFLDIVCYYLKNKLDDFCTLNAFSDSCRFVSYIRDNCFLPDHPAEILQQFYTRPPTEDTIKKALIDFSNLSAIVIIDQQLREEHQTGMSISKELREFYPASYIAMLTSELSHDAAVDLHNENYIDLFVRKDSTNSIEYLYGRIARELERRTRDFQYVEEEYEFPDDSIIYQPQYQEIKEKLLANEAHLAFLTINTQGDIAILSPNKQILICKYDNPKERFNLHELK